LGYHHDGYYSRAFGESDQTWKLGRNATSVPARLLIDRAVGELARMHARVGHGKELEAPFADIGDRLAFALVISLLMIMGFAIVHPEKPIGFDCSGYEA
jgi:hypothetical protein